MAQIKIFGLRSNLEVIRNSLSEAIHHAVMEALAYPAEKRFHRFIGLASEDFFYPPDRSERYIIIEISVFERRSAEVKKALIRASIDTLQRQRELRDRILRSPSPKPHVMHGELVACPGTRSA